MNSQPNKFAPGPLAKVLEGVELSEPAAAARRPDDDAPALVARLAQSGLFVDALKVAAAALPKREAVWMATRCVRELFPTGVAAPNTAALDAAQGWAHDPTDANRRLAQAAAEKAGLEQPFGCVALAAYLSEGSLGPPEVPPIPPAPQLCGVTVGLALEIALALLPREQVKSAGTRCVAIANEVAQTPAPWDSKSDSKSGARPTPGSEPKASAAKPTASPLRPPKR